MLRIGSVTLVRLFVVSFLAVAACNSDGDNSNENAGNTGGSCWPDAPECSLPDKVGFECLALADNGNEPVWSFRMSQLEIVKPTVLAKDFLQNTVITHALSLNMTNCYQEGTGRFTWLMQIDSKNNEIKTGGAHVQTDAKAGYCYVNEEVLGFQVQPTTVAVTMETQADGSVKVSTAKPIADMSVPIFLDDGEKDALMMPLHQVRLEDMIVAKDHDCIGAWLGDELEYDNNCKPIKDEGQRMQWKNAAVLSGYITLEEADTVWIPEMQQTLCVALSGDAGKYAEPVDDGKWKGKRCKRDSSSGKLLAAELADWCSADDKACSAPEADAFLLSGKFAASAVKILDKCD